jgi:hypothetical protein
MLGHPDGKSIMPDARFHTVDKPEKSHQSLLRYILGIVVVAEETAAYREHQLSERGGNMFELFLRHLKYKRMSTQKVKLKSCFFVI